MVGRAAGDHVHAVDEVELLHGQIELVDRKRAVHEATGQRVADDARLLVNLLEHEVGIAALLRHVDVPVDVRHARLDLPPRRIEARNGIG